MKKCTVLPVVDVELLPNVECHVVIDSLSDDEKMAISLSGDRIVLGLLNHSMAREDAQPEDFFPFGVDVEVLEMNEGPSGTVLHLRTHDKVEIEKPERHGAVFTAQCTIIRRPRDITEKTEQELLQSLKNTTLEVTDKIRGGEYAAGFLKNIKTINEFGMTFCQFMNMTIEEKYSLLETDSLKERGLLIRQFLMRFCAEVEVRSDLASAEGNEQASYRAAAIRRQLDYLQKQLDELEPKGGEQEADTFENRIAKSGMPENVRKEVEETLKRMNQQQPNSPDYATLHDYLDFVTSLPWKLEKREPVDIRKARRILDKDHYGLKDVKERILQHLAVMSLNEKNGRQDKSKGTILLLVGAPGTGKTSMGRSVAEALGRKYVRVSLGGIRDEAEIRGHRRTYIGAMPGRIMAGIKRAGTMDPVMVLDEVDKLFAGVSGDPSAALLEALDPEQNFAFEDHYVDLPYDLSNVVFICTANTWDTIPQPLLDRMEVIRLPGYTPDEHFHIAKRHLVPQAIEEAGLTRKEIRFTDGALRKIISEYTMEAGVRGLKKQILAACRKTAEMIVENVDKDGKPLEKPVALPVVITTSNLRDFLGRRKVTHEAIHDTGLNPAGVVTGLAWTQAGGEILFIESVAMNGTGQVKLTGQIGDVMRESAETAVSLVKSRLMDSGFDFKNRDIHIHIPEGAVPKDGPSAGVTIFTAVMSLVTGIPVSPTLAMTGEISLRGMILPIGGLPEKLMAAVRAGVKKVLIPEENVPDLEDVPEETKAKLEIVPVSTVSQVVREALHMKLPARNMHPFTPKTDGTAAPAAAR